MSIELIRMWVDDSNSVTKEQIQTAIDKAIVSTPTTSLSTTPKPTDADYNDYIVGVALLQIKHSHVDKHAYKQKVIASLLDYDR